MVDTEHVLEQMRAANPAPSLEQLAVDDLDLVRNIVVRERSAATGPVEERQQTPPDRLIPQQGLRPVLVTGLAFILVLGTLGGALLLLRGFDETATAGFACPPGSTPDQPGPADQPRPQWDVVGFTTFDPDSGRVLMLTGGSLWMFDVCTNTWTTAPAPGDMLVTDLVYDINSGRAISFGPGSGDGMAQVWAYESDGQTWTKMNPFLVDTNADPSEYPWVKAVYDPVTGLVVVKKPTAAAMWTYDVDTDTWAEIDQGAQRPPAALETDLTYDASVDRLIAYHPGRSTWEFDIRAGRWEEQTTNTPDVEGWGWMPVGEEFVYDEANHVAVFLSDGVRTYDASEHRWTDRQVEKNLRRSRAVAAATYDPVNQRIVTIVVGSGADPVAGVTAYDVATDEWVTLLEPRTAFACPPGSTPDQPGPAHRHPRDGTTTFDPGSGRVLMLASEGLWMFDVCVNTWTLAPGPEGVGGEFVYDVDSGRAIALDSEEEGVAQVWAYEPYGQTWTEMSRFAVGPPPEWFFPSFPQFKAAYDPVTGLVVLREIFTSQMWTYDVDTDSWTEIDQGTILPPAVAKNGPHVELLTYDASVDRLIMYVASDGAARTVLGTWEFDIRAGLWEEQETNTPAHPGLGWWPTGEAFVYDEANEVSVLFAEEYLATYDASEHRWTVLPHDSDTVGGTTVSITYDPVNERILVAGRFAFDVATGEWITLIEPTTE